jgi:hypothetical protein
MERKKLTMNPTNKNFSMYLTSNCLKKAGLLDWLKGYFLAMIPVIIIGAFPLIVVLMPIVIRIESTFVPTSQFGLIIVFVLYITIFLVMTASLAFTSLIIFTHISSVPIISLFIKNCLLGILLLLNVRNFYILDDLAPFVVFNTIIAYLVLLVFTYLAMKLVARAMFMKAKND